MNSNRKTARIVDTAQRKAARVAGLAYLLIIITSLLSMVFLDSKLTVKGDAVATVNNIMANELLFRIMTAYDLIMFTSVVILSLALYITLKPVSNNLALVALFWRMGEAILGGVTVLSSLIVLLLLNGENYSAVFESAQLQALVGLFLDVRWAAMTIVFVFLSLGSIVFSYLFFKSKYVPRILAAFGIFSFSLMLIWPFVNILLPKYAAIIQSVSLAPAILFEIIIGFWLLFKGVNVSQWDNPALESV